MVGCCEYGNEPPGSITCGQFNDQLGNRQFLEIMFGGDGGPLMVLQWLRYCATNRKVAGSIPDGVIGIFPLT
jgi:hypothetical protein